MKTETPRTTALIAEIVQNPGLEWTRAEVEQLGEHAMQLERELIELADAAKDVMQSSPPPIGEKGNTNWLAKIRRMAEAISAAHQNADLRQDAGSDRTNVK